MKSLKKISAVALLCAATVGAPVFQGCQKQVIDVNTTLPDKSETIVIPATDLSKVEALLTSILAKINGNEEAQLKELIAAVAGTNTALQAELEKVIQQLKDYQASTDKKLDAQTKELQEVKAKLADILEVVNAINDNLTKKVDAALTSIQEAIEKADGNNTAALKNIQDALTAIKTADATNAKNIIKALNSNHVELMAQIKLIVSKLDNRDLNAKLDELIALLNDSNAKQDVVLDKLQSVLEQMAQIANILSGAEADADYAEEYTFIPREEIAPSEELTLTDTTSILEYTEFAEGLYFYASAFTFVPSFGAVRVTEEQKQELLYAVDNDLRAMAETKSGEGDVLQAQALLRARINNMSSEWSNGESKLFEVSIDLNESVTDAKLNKIETDVEIVKTQIAVRATVNNVNYYVLGWNETAQGVGTPRYTITTYEGSTTHATEHTGHFTEHTGHSGHGEENNAGGGIFGK